MDNRIWTCMPQVRDLPRDLEIAVTCTCCGTRRVETVKAMIEERRVGAQFIDLLEWDMRCGDEDCSGRVRLDFEGKQAYAPPPPKIVTLPKPKTLPWPAQPLRASSARQYALPMPLPIIASQKSQPRQMRAGV